MRSLYASLEACSRQDHAGCVKTWEDLCRYQVALERARPRVVLELGTFSGRSAVWFADESGVPVITVDTHPQVSAETRKAAFGRVTWVNGNSTDPGVVRWVTDLVYACGLGPLGEPQAFVVCDSDHSRGHVLGELDAYCDLVPVGSYFVVEDGILHWMPSSERAVYDGDPLQALEEWLPVHTEFVPDEELEDMYPATLFPRGWLRRV